MREKLGRLTGKLVTAKAPNKGKKMSSSTSPQREPAPAPDVKTSSANRQQPQQDEVNRPSQQELVSGTKSTGPAPNGVTVKVDEYSEPVRMRTKLPLSQIQQQASSNGTTDDARRPEALNGSSGTDTRSVLQRGLEILNEVSAEDDGTEEIRKLDSQLDHLNHYMDKVEERIKTHNEKLMTTLRQQKEEREKRRRSFHERIETSRREDDDFQRRLSTLMSRVDVSKNRASMYDIISHMEIPKTNAE